jgi:hypothetical protein
MLLASVRDRALLDSRAFRDRVLVSAFVVSSPERGTHGSRRKRHEHKWGFGSLVAWVGSGR